MRETLPVNWQTRFRPALLRAMIQDLFTFDALSGQSDSVLYLKSHAFQVLGGSEDRSSSRRKTDKVNDDWPMSAKDNRGSDNVPRNRLLAIRRIGNARPRYLWYPWASRIFEAIDLGFFYDESSMRIWNDTFEAQRVHRDISWVEIRQYALALRAIQHGKSLDMKLNPQQLKNGLRKYLVDCCYSNGTFPTRIDLTTKQPTSKWADANSRAEGYEIPLLLLFDESECRDLAG